jgi:hypothetical protein
VIRLGLPHIALHNIHTLGVDGMSSEDSEGEVGGQNRQFNVKSLPWRNVELTKWLHALDLMSSETLQNGKSVPGRKWHRDRCIGGMPSVRAPPKGLPRDFYDTKWIASLNPAQIDALQIEHVSHTSFIPPLADRA